MFSKLATVFFVFLAVLPPQFSSGLNCYNCTESKVDSKQTGGPCYNPDKNTATANGTDCKLCSVEIRDKTKDSPDMIVRRCFASTDLGEKCEPKLNPDTHELKTHCGCNEDLCIPEKNNGTVSSLTSTGKPKKVENTPIPEENPKKNETAPTSDSSTLLISWTFFVSSLVLSAKFAF